MQKEELQTLEKIVTIMWVRKLNKCFKRLVETIPSHSKNYRTCQFAKEQKDKLGKM